MISLDRVRELLSHEEFAVRNAAIEFFVDGGLTDLDLTHRVLDLFKDARNAYEYSSLLHQLAELEHDCDTLRELLSIADKRFWTDAGAIFKLCDIQILDKAFPGGIADKKCLDILNRRKVFAQTPTLELWQMLWDHSEQANGVEYGKFDYELGEMMINELAARSDFPYDEYYEKIATDFPGDYSGWDDTYLSYLAGELGSERSIEFLLDSVEIDGDLICEKAAAALGKIGGSAVVEAIKRRYAESADHFKIYITGVFEHIKTDESEDAVIELWAKEQDVSTKTQLADALCRNFSQKGLSICLSMLENGYDSFQTNLEESVYITHIAHGLNHPQMDDWKASIDRDYKNCLRIYEEGVSNDFEFNNKSIASALQQAVDHGNDLRQIQQKYDKNPKPGRNDPCPCGSGQKYKRCCGR